MNVRSEKKGVVKLKKIGVLFSAKLQTVIFGVAGLIAGVLYSFGGLLIDALVSLGWITSAETPGLSYGTVLAFGALIGMPLIFAGIGFVVGIIGAVLYNVVVGRVGIELDIETHKPL